MTQLGFRRAIRNKAGPLELLSRGVFSAAVYTTLGASVSVILLAGALKARKLT